MKLSNTPQDDAGLSDGVSRELCYVTNENGEYTTELSIGWEPKNIAIIEAWRDIKDQLEDIVEEIKTGKKSPLEYYMALNLMNRTLLSQISGISKWRVKRHFKPKNFNKLKPETLEKYAGVLKIESSLLRNFELFETINVTEEIFKKTGVKL
jgi:hypothetical protein